MAEAKLNREYALRMGGVGVLMLGLCVWSLYDGTTAWPQKNAAMERVRPALLATNLTAEAWISNEEGGGSPLEAEFRKAGYALPSKLIKKLGELRVPDSAQDRVRLRSAQDKKVRDLFERPVYSAHDLQTQFVQGAITFALGLAALTLVGLRACRRYVADEAGLHGSGFGGRTVAYDDLARIDWTKWDEKGIVVLTVKSGQRLTLDGWHFAGMAGVVDEISRRRPDLATAARRKEEGEGIR